MAARLGNVLYWIGCIGAVPPLIFAAYLFYVSQTAPGANTTDTYIFVGLGLAIAFVIWGIGRACRYVLAGR